tara:strand:- start:171 stop:425 length:255 start_codon:yes stop_codon:yes gene_type:complete
MKITKQRLKQIIKEELQVSEAPLRGSPENSPKEDIQDAIGMIEAEFGSEGTDDPTGRLNQVINRLGEAVRKLEAAGDNDGYISF